MTRQIVSKEAKRVKVSKSMICGDMISGELKNVICINYIIGI